MDLKVYIWEIYRVFIKYCVFSKDFRIFRTWSFSVFPWVQCVYTHQAGRTPTLQQNTIFNEHPVSISTYQFFRPSIHPPTHQPIYPSKPPTHPHFYQPVHPSTHPSIYMFHLPIGAWVAYRGGDLPKDGQQRQGADCHQGRVPRGSRRLKVTFQIHFINTEKSFLHIH